IKAPGRFPPRGSYATACERPMARWPEGRKGHGVDRERRPEDRGVRLRDAVRERTGDESRGAGRRGARELFRDGLLQRTWEGGIPTRPDRGEGDFGLRQGRRRGARTPRSKNCRRAPWKRESSQILSSSKAIRFAIRRRSIDAAYVRRGSAGFAFSPCQNPDEPANRFDVDSRGPKDRGQFRQLARAVGVQRNTR